jgi:hypothetical protein
MHWQELACERCFQFTSELVAARAEDKEESLITNQVTMDRQIRVISRRSDHRTSEHFKN